MGGKPNEPSYFAILPADIRYDKKLKANEKLLYSEITSLSSTEGYCWASNNYFAKLYNVSKRTVQRWLFSLQSYGHIKIFFNKKKVRHIQMLTKKNIKRVKNFVDKG